MFKLIRERERERERDFGEVIWLSHA